MEKEKIKATWTLFDELFQLRENIKKADVASSQLKCMYFDEYGENNPEIMKMFEKAGYLHDVVKDYIEQSSKLIDDLMNC